MLDSPEGVCAGQARFEYPATFVLFGKCSLDVQLNALFAHLPGQGLVDQPGPPYLLPRPLWSLSHEAVGHR
jgi:hypothetical protein